MSRKPHVAITPELQEEIRRRIDAGQSYRKISADLEVSISSISRVNRNALLQTRQARGEEPDLTLYRHFDADGTLLYIGITDNPRLRVRHHRERTDWFARVVTTTYERGFATREALEHAEAIAIRREHPLLNERKAWPQDDPD